MPFPSQDFSNQYISESYQNVLQKYVPIGSTSYVLDGAGNVIFSLPSASVGGQLMTADQTASFAVSASYAPGSPSVSSSYATNATFSDTASIAIEATFSDTASLSLQAVTASYVLTASYVAGQPPIKSGVIASSSFQGVTSKTSSVVFGIPFASGFSLSVIAEDVRIITVESKSLSGFTLNTNSDVVLTGSVYWQAIQYGEYN